MSGQKRILIAFILNVVFSIVEFFGGLFTGSMAIMSDALHDAGDAISIGISYIMERVSTRKPNASYTYGYKRYSVLGGLITITILIGGSLFVIINALSKLSNDVEVNYDGMIALAVVGCIINTIAGIITHGNDINQKAVRLHLFEDVLGWIAVLIGAVVIKLTGWYIIDPILSIVVAMFILVTAIKSLIEILKIFVVKTPDNINFNAIKSSLVIIPGVHDIHSMRIWTIDGENMFIAMHVVAQYNPTLKRIIKNTLKKHGIYNSTIEFESPGEKCISPEIVIKSSCKCEHCH